MINLPMDEAWRRNYIAAACIMLTLVLLAVAVLVTRFLRLRRSRPRVIVIVGSPHSGKTKLFYALTCQATVDTVTSAIPSVYSGYVDAIPGLPLRVYDVPSDVRTHSSLPDDLLAQASAVVYCTAGCAPDYADIYKYVDVCCQSKRLRRLLILSPGDDTDALAEGLRKHIAEETSAALQDTELPAQLSLLQCDTAHSDAAGCAEPLLAVLPKVLL